MGAEAVPVVLLYDRDCGLCVWILAKILVWDRARRLRPVALQDAEADRLLEGMVEVRRMESWHLVASDGTVCSAGRAFAPLLALLPGGAPLRVLADWFPATAQGLYRAVAGRRSRIGRLIPDSARGRAHRRVAQRGRR